MKFIKLNELDFMGGPYKEVLVEVSSIVKLEPGTSRDNIWEEIETVKGWGPFKKKIKLQAPGRGPEYPACALTLTSGIRVCTRNTIQEIMNLIKGDVE